MAPRGNFPLLRSKSDKFTKCWPYLCTNNNGILPFASRNISQFLKSFWLHISLRGYGATPSHGLFYLFIYFFLIRILWHGLALIQCSLKIPMFQNMWKITSPSDTFAIFFIFLCQKVVKRQEILQEGAAAHITTSGHGLQGIRPRFWKSWTH